MTLHFSTIPFSSLEKPYAIFKILELNEYLNLMTELKILWSGHHFKTEFWKHRYIETILVLWGFTKTVMSSRNAD